MRRYRGRENLEMIARKGMDGSCEYGSPGVSVRPLWIKISQFLEFAPTNFHIHDPHEGKC